VFLQDPRIPASQFDLIAVPRHDKLRGPNVIVTEAAPNRITPHRLDEARDEFAHAFEDLPSPRIAVLIGGDSKAYKMTESVTRRLTAQLRAIIDRGDCSMMVTTSRRTGAANQKIIDDALLETDAWIWDGLSDNPYFGFLAWADVILVTADSVSMISEAATTGKPVYIIPLEGAGHPRITAFHRNMMDCGAARLFDGTIDYWTYTPLNDAARVAEAIKNRMNKAI
jgi:mitochondrial fission protein ELM1